MFVVALVIVYYGALVFRADLWRASDGFFVSQCLTRGYSILFSCYVLFGSLVWFLWLLASVVV